MPLRQSIRWRSLEHGGLEQLRISEWPEAIKARAAIVGQSGDDRHGVLYEISLTPDWLFESILLQRTDGVMSVLSRGKNGEWYDAQVEELPQLEGCIDIDFQMTPFTNSLPIRRTPLEIGETRRFRMAYIPADTLEPYPDEQIYTRLSERVYRFENGEGVDYFAADITVDENGLVTDYPGLFARVD
jgi:uncharacterized protein